ncbi:hypothetical protein HALA3H3_260006 [Halomonas sp. A3H3]|nr:hypothetical protein HALA3H3_260006 [Halomonas sp. A3H3]
MPHKDFDNCGCKGYAYHKADVMLLDLSPKANC